MSGSSGALGVIPCPLSPNTQRYRPLPNEQGLLLMVPEQVCWEEGLSLSLEKAQSFQIQLEGSRASLPNCILPSFT